MHIRKEEAPKPIQGRVQVTNGTISADVINSAEAHADDYNAVVTDSHIHAKLGRDAVRRL